MGTIFISHSSKDNEIAAELNRRLGEQGHRSVFLDFDPAVGIPPGRNWESELYRQLRACQAVIVLCSEHSMSSRWCFAEITHAKSLGKNIFPIKISPCEIDPVLTSRQIIDLAQNPEEAYQRLWHGLKVAGLDPANAFKWKPNRPPYPGLMAFQEEDAAIFFGRDPEIQAGLETLRRQRQFGGARMLLMLGASGSGKSSLVRAGLIPRLRRNPDQWLIVDPFRPRMHPLRELSIVLAKAFASCGKEREWKKVRDFLDHEAGNEIPFSDNLNSLALELQVSASRPEATVLLVIDQAEELLNPSEEDEASRFLLILSRALEASDSPLIALCTLRSDFLGDFQRLQHIVDLPCNHLPVGPISVDRLTKVIEGPAQIAGVEFEDGLTEALVADVENETALPLLAFTLRELYERYGNDKLLEVNEYTEKLGGLSGSVAHAADEVFAARRLTKEQEKDLQASFVALARINEEGHFTRQSVQWSDLPESVHEDLECFVKARLLISRDEEGERILEVAHEAIFHSWHRLKSWLDKDREFLLWRKRLGEAKREWERTNHDRSTLLKGPNLEEGLSWLKQRGRRLSPGECQYVGESAREEKRCRLRKLAALTGVMAFLVAAAFAGILLWQRAELQTRQVQVRALAADAELAMNQRSAGLTRSILLAVEAMHRSIDLGRLSLQADQALRKALALLPRKVAGMDLKEKFILNSVSPDGERTASVSQDGVIHIMEVQVPHKTAQIDIDQSIDKINFSPDGDLLSIISRDDIGMLIDVNSGRQVLRIEHEDGICGIVFSPKGRYVVSKQWRKQSKGRSCPGSLLQVWNTTDPGKKFDIDLSPQRLEFLRFSPDERLLASMGKDMISVWEQSTGKELLSKKLDKPGRKLEFSRDGKLLAIKTASAGLLLWNLASGRDMRIAEDDHVSSFAFGPDGDSLFTVSGEGVIRIWDIGNGSQSGIIETNSNDDCKYKFMFNGKESYLTGLCSDNIARVWALSRGREVVKLKHDDKINEAIINHDGSFISTSSIDGTARVWSLPEGQEVARIPHEGVSPTIGFSPGGRFLVTTSYYDPPSVWEVTARPELVRVSHTKRVTAVGFSRDENFFVTAGADGTARIVDISSGREEHLMHGDAVEAAVLSLSGELVATASNDKTARTWEVATGREVSRFKHSNGARVVAFSPDGQWVASGEGCPRGRSCKAAIVVWGANNGRVVSRMFHEDGLRAIVFSPNNKWLASASSDGTARVWEAKTGRSIARIDHDRGAVNTVAFDKDGKYLATGGSDNTVRLWSLAKGEEIYKFSDKQEFLDVTFSPDGRYLAASTGLAGRETKTPGLSGLILLTPSGKKSGSMVVWDLKNGSEIQRISQEDSITRVAFSADGRHIATASDDRTARVWEIDTGHEITRVFHDDAVVAISYSTDGKYLLTGSWDGTAKLWLWRPEDLIDQACARLSRNLTLEEWEQYIETKPYRQTCANLPEHPTVLNKRTQK